MESKHKTKENIEKIALSLLNKGSLQGCGVNQLIKKCKITKGSLYCHFPGGKKHIVKNALLNVNQSYIQSLENFYEKNLSLGEVLNNIVLYKAEMLEKNKFTACSPIVRISIDATSQEKEIQDMCIHFLEERNHFHYNKLLLFGFSKHDAEKKAYFIGCALEGGVLLSRAHKSKIPLLQTGLILKEIFKENILK